MTTLNAELLFVSGELEAAVRVLRPGSPPDRSNDGRTASLLFAELALRLGDRSAPLAVADQLLAGDAFPVERARAHGLRGLVAALSGDRATAAAELARTSGVRGLGDGWLAVHRRWIHRLSGGDPDTDLPPVPPDELALIHALDEARGASPAWAQPRSP